MIEKRLEYMRKLGATQQEIDEYCRQHRQFYVIRNMEIVNALKTENYIEAISVLLESRKLDENNRALLEKYSRKLLEIYSQTGKTEEYAKELEYNLLNCHQPNVNNFMALKTRLSGNADWPKLVERIIAKHQRDHVVYDILQEEKRYDQIMDLICWEQSI